MASDPQKEFDARRPAARRTALLVGLIAFAVYAMFFLRAVLNAE